MSRAKTYRFLCGCLSKHLSDPQREMFSQLALSSGLDWTDFIVMASESPMHPRTRRARANGVAELLPHDVVDYLDGMAILNWQRNSRIRSEISEIAAVFAEIGVAPVLLKGAAHLMSGLYDDIGDRVMLDIDLLVPQARLQNCADALKREGFRILPTMAFRPITITRRSGVRAIAPPLSFTWRLLTRPMHGSFDQTRFLQHPRR